MYNKSNKNNNVTKPFQLLEIIIFFFLNLLLLFYYLADYF